MVRRLGFLILFVQLLIGSIGWSHARTTSKDAAIDVALAGASIARLPDRTIEASDPATTPSTFAVPFSSCERADVERADVPEIESRIVRAPTARGPPLRA